MITVLLETGMAVSGNGNRNLPLESLCLETLWPMDEADLTAGRGLYRRPCRSADCGGVREHPLPMGGH